MGWARWAVTFERLACLLSENLSKANALGDDDATPLATIARPLAE